MLTLLAIAVIGPFSPAIAATPSTRVLRAELDNHQQRSFNGLLNQWERKYGTKAAAPLMAIAADKKVEDPQRYIAIMAASRLGGTAIAPVVRGFLNDRSWMLRIAAIRILAGLGSKEHAAALLGMLDDHALVVRNEAVTAISQLKPVNYQVALAGTLNKQENYHHGKGLWVPQNVLTALLRDGAPKSVAKELEFPLGQIRDSSLQAQTIAVLEKITGKTVKTTENDPKKRLNAQVAEWKKILAAL